MKQVTDKEFAVYGRVLDVDVKEFVDVMKEVPVVSEGTMYEPSVGAFEDLPLAKTLEQESFGFLPIEFGHCSGYNNKLNALEYHRSSEIDIAATDLILLVGRQQDIDLSSYTYDTARVEAFFVAARQSSSMRRLFTLHRAASTEKNSAAVSSFRKEPTRLCRKRLAAAAKMPCSLPSTSGSLLMKRAGCKRTRPGSV